MALGLSATGFGRALAPVGAARPQASGNRVSYARDGLSEWYANGPLGLEQGFTIQRPPAGARRGALTLSMRLGGDARAGLGADGASVSFSAPGGPTIGYSGLRASDADGRPLASRLALREGHLLIEIDARGASYPVRVDPFVHKGEKLTASGLGGPYGYVGMSVALSADGSTALIGAPADDEYTGSAFVFTRSGSTWTQQAKLTGSGTQGESWFGESVAISADGNTALIGGPSDDEQVGAAWVFTRSGSTWTEQGSKLTGAGESGNAFFGKSVALSADGDLAMVGGYNDNEHRGAAWVFTRTGSTWVQEGSKLTGGGEEGFFGWSVALSSEGTTALVGEWGLGGGIGAAWAFTRAGSSWSKQGGALTALGSSEYTWFGYSVALSAGGGTAVIGAPHADGYAGAAWVYTRTGSTWAEQGSPLTGEEEIGEGELGYSSALSADGSSALLGGRVDDTFHGAAWAFSRSGASWRESGGKLTGSAETSNREEFGWSVALSAAGSTAIVGSPCDKACIGSASVFATAAEPPEYGRCVKVTRGAGAFASGACTTTGGAADYEWEAGVIAGGLTAKLTSGAPSVETVKGWKMLCTGASAVGAHEGERQLSGLVLTLTGCERSGEHCESGGAPAGEVVSSPLEGTLGVEKLGTSATKNKIGLDLSPVAHGGPLLEFTCGTSAAVVRGSVIAPVRANLMSLTAPLKFNEGKGKQKPESFSGGPRDVLEVSLAGGPFEQAGLKLALTQTNEEKVEIDSTV